MVTKTNEKPSMMVISKMVDGKLEKAFVKRCQLHNMPVEACSCRS